jgi:hypothetical protein
MVAAAEQNPHKCGHWPLTKPTRLSSWPLSGAGLWDSRFVVRAGNALKSGAKQIFERLR